jgi:hypothetical protein
VDRAGFAARVCVFGRPRFVHDMLVIRRLVDRRRAYTALLLKGEPPRIFPTSDAEHARILQIYLQDKPHPGVDNDYSRLTLYPPEQKGRT